MVLTIFLLLINDMMICFGSSLLGTFEARLPCSLLYLCGVLRLDSPENPLLHGPYVGVVQELDLEQIYFQLFPKNVKVTTSKARLLNIMSSAFLVVIFYIFIRHLLYDLPPLEFCCLAVLSHLFRPFQLLSCFGTTVIGKVYAILLNSFKGCDVYSFRKILFKICSSI